MFAETEVRSASCGETRRRFRLAGLVAVLGFATAWLVWAPAATAATNNIFTVAGVGTEGLSGDGDLATLAEFSLPADVAATANGAFLIADSTNNRVRRVSPRGIITTVAGDGTPAFGGDGGLAIDAQLKPRRG